MMEFDYVVLADGATQRPDGKVDIFGAGIDRIFASAVPAMHAQMSLAMRVLMTPWETERPHEVLVVVAGADGQELGRVVAQLPAMAAEDRQRLDTGRVGVGLVFQLARIVFPIYGEYQVSVMCDGREERSLHLDVVPPPTTQ